MKQTQKLKNLATQKKILVNPKHVQTYSLPLSGKILIASNDEYKIPNKSVMSKINKL